MVRVTAIAAGVVTEAVESSTEEVEATQDPEAIEEAEASKRLQGMYEATWAAMDMDVDALDAGIDAIRSAGRGVAVAFRRWRDVRTTLGRQT